MAIFAVYVCDPVGLWTTNILLKDIFLNYHFTTGVSYRVRNPSKREDISIYDCRVLSKSISCEKKDRTWVKHFNIKQAFIGYTTQKCIFIKSQIARMLFKAEESFKLVAWKFFVSVEQLSKVIQRIFLQGILRIR